MASRQQTLFLLMIVALAFATTTLTELRFGELPIGVPEFILLGCMLVHLPLGGGVHVEPGANRFIVGLFLFFAATMPGFFSTLVSQGLLPDVMHNLLALAWMLVLFAYLQFGFDYRRGELDWLCRMVLLFSCLYFVICLALVGVSPDMVFTREDVVDLTEIRDEEMLAIERLTGFADNPNQLGLHAIVALFFCLRFWRTNGMLLSTIAFALIMATGVLTGSDSFIFGAGLMVGVAVVLGLLLSGSIYAVLLILVPAAVGAFLLYRPLLVRVRDLTSANDQDQTRYLLWENGWLATLERPLIGWGPGNWSGKTGPLEFFEAHNSVIDYVSNSGLLGGVVLVGGLAALFFGALRSRQATLFAGLCGIVFFALFHHTFRQPLMWLVMFYVTHHVWTERGEPGGGRRRRRRRGPRDAAPAL